MKVLFCIAVLFFSGKVLHAQQGKLSKEVCDISAYIASEQFLRDRKNLQDREAINLIFQKAVEVCENDTSEALISASFACVPFNVIPATTPLIKIKIPMRIFSADETTFRKKNTNLPGSFFLDTPNEQSRDRDKLAHFFGGAFITHASNSVELSKFIGYLVEAIESVLMVDPIDLRDVRADIMGATYGKLLRQGQRIQPSTVFTFYLLSSVSFVL